jgi:hypothetical protein
MYVVAEKHLVISADAALRGVPYMESGETLLRFDDKFPGGVMGVRGDATDETVFETREQAEAAVQTVLARCEAALAMDPSANVGIYHQLRPAVIAGQTYGGTAVVEYAPYVEKRNEIQRLRDIKQRAQVEEADKRALQAKQAADKLREQLAKVEPITTPDGSTLKTVQPTATRPGIQHERRADGTDRWRCRRTFAGKMTTGPWAETEEAAIRGWEFKNGKSWDEQGPSPSPKVATIGVMSDEQVEALS